MTASYLVSVVWVAVFTVIQVQALDSDKLVFLRELDVNTKRSVESLPDQIPLRVSSRDGDFQLLLTRNKDIDDYPTQIIVKSRDSQTEYHLDQRSHGFYHDLDKHAVIHVQLVEQQGQMKRRYTGTLAHDSKAYELHPVETADRFERELQERAEEAVGSQLHVLTHQNPGNYLSDTILEDRERRSPDLEKFFDQRAGGNSGSNNNNGGKSKEAEKVDTILPDKERNPNIEIDNKPSDSNPTIEQLERLLYRLKQKEEKKQIEINRRRRRRSVQGRSGLDNQDYKLELAFLVDNKLYEYWYTKMKRNEKKAIEKITILFKHMFNGMYMLYRRINKATDGFTLTPVLRKMEVSKDPQGYCAHYKLTDQGFIDGRDGIEKALYENERKYKPENKWMNIDHIMVWTGRRIIQNGRETLGFSPVGKICDPFFGYSLVAYRGFFSWLAGGHELSHNIGARHDGYDNKCASNKYMMSPHELSADTVVLPFTFSPCSIGEMKGYLAGHTDGVGKTCLTDDPCNDKFLSLSLLNKPIGQLLSLDEQCELLFKPDEKATYDKTCNKKDDICGKLYCKVNNQCTSPDVEFKALPGTSCGRDQWCMWGKCVKIGRNQYHDASGRCDKGRKRRALVKNIPPLSCVDRNSQCQYAAEEFPFSFYLDGRYRGACPATAYKYGLYFDFQDPCVSPDLEGVLCSNKKYTINYRQLCDGNNDCGDNSDEMDSFCEAMSVRLPFCKDKNRVFCPKTFTFRCIDPQLGCDGVHVCPKDEDEKKTWCKKLPKQKCHPGFVPCSKNPARCCPNKR